MNVLTVQINVHKNDAFVIFNSGTSPWPLLFSWCTCHSTPNTL